MLLTKQEVLEAMVDQDALNFAGYLTSDDPDAIKMRLLWDSVDDLNIASSLVQEYLIPQLVTKGVISASSADAVLDAAMPSF